MKLFLNQRLLLQPWFTLFSKTPNQLNKFVKKLFKQNLFYRLFKIIFFMRASFEKNRLGRILQNHKLDFTNGFATHCGSIKPP